MSIHINASVKSEINGIETHYYTDNGYNVAKVIHKELHLRFLKSCEGADAFTECRTEGVDIFCSIGI